MEHAMSNTVRTAVYVRRGPPFGVSWTRVFPPGVATMLNPFSLFCRPSWGGSRVTRPRSPRLGFEPLEDRYLLSAFLVTTNANAGVGSLAAAVAQAGTGDVITFSGALAGQPITLSSPLTLSQGVTILGQGPDVIILNGGGTGRLFNVTSASLVTIAGVTITGGRTVAPNTNGGAILNTGHLVLDSDVLTGNQVLGPGSEGGAIANIGAGAVLTINKTTISGGFATGGGGGLFNDTAAQTTLTASTLLGNRASAQGSGIDNKGTLVINTTLLGSEVAAAGGNFGGAINNQAGATLTLNAASLIGNAAIHGGGALNNDGTATLINTTMVANNVLEDGGPGGGAISNTGTLNLFNSTITGNGDASASLTSAGNISTTGGTVLLRNTIVAEGTTGNGASPDVNGTVSSSSSNNFIGAADARLVGITNGGNQNQVGTVANPMNDLLGMLQNNGGPTANRVPLPSSPVINAGKNTLIPPGVTKDQRGFNRIIQGTVDIGAVEFQPPQTTTTLAVLVSSSPAGQAAMLTATVAGPTADSNPAAGLVTFYTGGTLTGGILVGGTPLGTATLGPAGKAVLVVSTPGAYQFTAVFDGNFALGELGSTSTQVSQVLAGPPPVTQARGIVAALVSKKVKKVRRLFVRVTFADTGALKAEVRSPFQGPAFRRILAAAFDSNGDGVADTVRLTARRGKKTLTRFLAL
jgi:hypothetical protein